MLPMHALVCQRKPRARVLVAPSFSKDSQPARRISRRIKHSAPFSHNSWTPPINARCLRWAAGNRRPFQRLPRGSVSRRGAASNRCFSLP